MKRRKAKIELLTPDLDPSIPFVPGYDLLDQTSLQNRSSLKDSDIAAIALALWELSGSEAKNQHRSLWREAHAASSFEGGSFGE